MVAYVEAEPAIWITCEVGWITSPLQLYKSFGNETESVSQCTLWPTQPSLMGWLWKSWPADCLSKWIRMEAIFVSTPEVCY